MTTVESKCKIFDDMINYLMHSSGLPLYKAQEVLSTLSRSLGTDWRETWANKSIYRGDKGVWEAIRNS